LFFIIEPGTIASKQTGNGLIGFYIHFVVDLRLFFLLIGCDFLCVFSVGSQVMEVRVDYKLSFDAEIGEKGKLGDSMGFEVNFEPNVLDKIGVLDGEG
jgi:hypothetical protein